MADQQFRVRGYCPKGHPTRIMTSQYSASLVDWIRARSFDEHRHICHECGKGYRLSQFTWQEIKPNEHS